MSNLRKNRLAATALRRDCTKMSSTRRIRLKSARTYPHGSAILCSMNGSTAPALGALLAKHQIDLTVEEVLDELDSAFAAIPGATTLSTTEMDFLRTHAEPGAAAVIDAWSADNERQARARIALRQLASALSGSVSIKKPPRSSASTGPACRGASPGKHYGPSISKEADASRGGSSLVMNCLPAWT